MLLNLQRRYTGKCPVRHDWIRGPLKVGSAKREQGYCWGRVTLCRPQTFEIRSIPYLSQSGYTLFTLPITAIRDLCECEEWVFRDTREMPWIIPYKKNRSRHLRLVLGLQEASKPVVLVCSLSHTIYANQPLTKSHTVVDFMFKEHYQTLHTKALTSSRIWQITTTLGDLNIVFGS